nr:CapA family protein [Mobilitalea sibirica]
MNESKNGAEDISKDDTKDVFDTIIISAAGDVTLGRDANYGYERSFDHELKIQNKDYGYFFRNVKDIFEADDITVVNLETTLTKSKKAADKKFRFKADPSYVEILKEGDIEVVSIANNHTRDYLDKGYRDTLTTLESAGIGYFGYEHKYIEDIRGIKVGFLGYVSWEVSKNQKKEIKQAIEGLKEDGADIVIAMFHWGIERDYYPNYVQKELARYTIDNGANLVLGAHPHVLQGIEDYNGKKIVYSLGNFSFGGNKNPSDKDTMVYIHKFNFVNGILDSEESEIIPCSISSVKERNNYQPTPLEGSEKKRVMKKIEKYSNFSY